MPLPVGAMAVSTPWIAPSRAARAAGSVRSGTSTSIGESTPTGNPARWRATSPCSAEPERASEVGRTSPTRRPKAAPQRIPSTVRATPTARRR